MDPGVNPNVTGFIPLGIPPEISDETGVAPTPPSRTLPPISDTVDSDAVIQSFAGEFLTEEGGPVLQPPVPVIVDGKPLSILDFALMISSAMQELREVMLEAEIADAQLNRDDSTPEDVANDAVKENQTVAEAEQAVSATLGEIGGQEALESPSIFSGFLQSVESRFVPTQNAVLGAMSFSNLTPPSFSPLFAAAALMHTLLNNEFNSFLGLQTLMEGQVSDLNESFEPFNASAEMMTARLNIAAEQFANGEISESEYREVADEYNAFAKDPSHTEGMNREIDQHNEQAAENNSEIAGRNLFRQAVGLPSLPYQEPLPHAESLPLAPSPSQVQEGVRLNDPSPMEAPSAMPSLTRAVLEATYYQPVRNAVLAFSPFVMTAAESAATALMAGLITPWGGMTQLRREMTMESLINSLDEQPGYGRNRAEREVGQAMERTLENGPYFSEAQFLNGLRGELGQEVGESAADEMIGTAAASLSNAFNLIEFSSDRISILQSMVIGALINQLSFENTMAELLVRDSFAAALSLGPHRSEQGFVANLRNHFSLRFMGAVAGMLNQTAVSSLSGGLQGQAITDARMGTAQESMSSTLQEKFGYSDQYASQVVDSAFSEAKAEGPFESEQALMSAVEQKLSKKVGSFVADEMVGKAAAQLPDGSLPVPVSMQRMGILSAVITSALQNNFDVSSGLTQLAVNNAMEKTMLQGPYSTEQAFIDALQVNMASEFVSMQANQALNAALLAMPGFGFDASADSPRVALIGATLANHFTESLGLPESFAQEVVSGALARTEAQGPYLSEGAYLNKLQQELGPLFGAIAANSLIDSAVSALPQGIAAAAITASRTQQAQSAMTAALQQNFGFSQALSSFITDRAVADTVRSGPHENEQQFFNTLENQISGRIGMYAAAMLVDNAVSQMEGGLQEDPINSVRMEILTLSLANTLQHDFGFSRDFAEVSLSQAAAQTLTEGPYPSEQAFVDALQNQIGLQMAGWMAAVQANLALAPITADSLTGLTVLAHLMTEQANSLGDLVGTQNQQIEVLNGAFQAWNTFNAPFFEADAAAATKMNEAIGQHARGEITNDKFQAEVDNYNGYVQGRVAAEANALEAVNGAISLYNTQAAANNVAIGALNANRIQSGLPPIPLQEPIPLIAPLGLISAQQLNFLPVRSEAAPPAAISTPPDSTSVLNQFYTGIHQTVMQLAMGNFLETAMAFERTTGFPVPIGALVNFAESLVVQANLLAGLVSTQNDQISTVNQAISGFGQVLNDNNQIDGMNEALSGYLSGNVDESEYNEAVDGYNSYAMERNQDIDNYNAQATLYNTQVEQNNQQITAMNVARTLVGLPPIPLQQPVPVLDRLPIMPHGPLEEGSLEGIAAMASLSAVDPIPEPPSVREVIAALFLPVREASLALATLVVNNRVSDLAAASLAVRGSLNAGPPFTFPNQFVEGLSNLYFATRVAPNLNDALGALAVGIGSQPVEQALGRSAMMDIAMRLGVPLPVETFDQLQVLGLQMLNEAALLAANPAVHLLGAGFGGLEAESPAVQLAVGISFANRVRDLITTNVLSSAVNQILTDAQVKSEGAITPEQALNAASAFHAVLGFNLINTAITRLAVSLQVPGLVPQILGNIFGQEQVGEIAENAVNANVNSVLNDPVAMLYVKAAVVNNLVLGRGLARAIAELHVNTAIGNVLASGTDFQNTDQLRMGMIDGFREQGFNFLTSIVLANEAAAYIQAEMLSPFLNIAFSLDFNKESFVDNLAQALAVQGFALDEGSELLEGALARTLDGGNFQTMREFRDGLVQQLLIDGLSRNVSFLVATLAVEFVVTGAIQNVEELSIASILPKDGHPLFSANPDTPLSQQALAELLVAHVIAMMTPDVGMEQAQELANQTALSLFGDVRGGELDAENLEKIMALIAMLQQMLQAVLGGGIPDIEGEEGEGLEGVMANGLGQFINPDADFAFVLEQMMEPSNEFFQVFLNGSNDTSEGNDIYPPQLFA